MMKNRVAGLGNPISIWDVLIVLLNIAVGRGNYLLFGLTGFTKGTWTLGIVILSNILYLILNGKVNNALNLKLKYSPFAIVFTLLLYNWFSVIVQGNGDFVTTTEVTIEWVLFYMVLCKLCYKLTYNSSVGMNDGVLALSKGYILLSLISVVGVFIFFFALRIGIASRGRIVELDYMEANINGGALYEWVLLSINNLQYEFGRIPFFQDYGTLTGLFHEPNIITHNITPCMILLLGLLNKTIWRSVAIAVGVLIMLFSASVTNVLVVAVCLLVYVFVKFRSNVFVSILTAAIAVGAVLLFIRYSDDTFLNFFMGRMDRGNASNAYTTSVIEHTFVPHTIFGYNFLSTSYISDDGVLDNSLDIGFIPWLLNIIFLVLYFRNVIKLITKNNSAAMAVGFASLYYILHAAKGGMTMFLQLLPALLIFLQIYVLNYYGTVTSHTRSIKNREETKA